MRAPDSINILFYLQRIRRHLAYTHILHVRPSTSYIPRDSSRRKNPCDSTYLRTIFQIGDDKETEEEEEEEEEKRSRCKKLALSSK